MSFEGNVAVVALIVSLIALLIALTQASVQLFSTAVGYSKCAESIIGPWSSKRHRRWLWSEFRFETQFVTPHIVLFTPLELLAAGDNACLLSLQRGDRKDFPEVELSLHPNSDITRVRRTDSSGRKLSNLQSQADLETRMILTHGRTANSQQVWSGSMVTWLTLLREAHSVYVKYWPDEHCFEHEFSDKIFHRNRPSRPSRITSGSMALKSSIRKARPAVGHQNEQRSDVGVIYRTWSWDLMPDMVRPLATSTVGDIVVLALRLGMEWTELDLGQGKMQASGNGCSLTSTEVRGLGILASFSAAGGQGASPYLVPSRAVDKLMCGVLPGSPQLVHRDYNLIGRDRELLKDEILGALEISDDIRSSIMKRDRRLTHNDILTLLCTFLPQKDSSAANHYCWYWREASPFSVFHWWEGRYALLRSLRKRVSHLAESESKVLRDALVRFEALSSGEYEEDFFSRWQDANLSNSGDEPVKSRAYLIGVRDIFDWTTEYFESMRFGSWEINGMTPYTRLVAAHLSMIHEAIEVVNEMLRKQKDARADVSQEALKRKYDLDGVHSYFFGQNMYEYGIAYAEHVDHPDFGVVKYFRDRDNSLPEAAIVDAWWVLMLRGVAWDMGTVGRAGPGQAVPSYLFNNQTPVWIT